MPDVNLSDSAIALQKLNAEWAERNTELIALQKQARQLANQITTVQRKQAALQQAMAAIIATNGRPVITAADFT